MKVLLMARWPRCTLAWLSTIGLAAVLWVPSMATAQVGHDETPHPHPGPLVLELGYNVRALGLGGAYWTANADSDAIFHHPALISGEGFGASAHPFGGNNALLVTMSGSGEWFGGSVAAGVAFLQYGSRTSSVVDLPQDVHGLISGGKVAGSEVVANVGFAGELFGFGVGGAAKVIGQRLARHAGATAALDLGVGREVGPVMLALTVQNLGPEMTFSGPPGPGSRVPLARRVALGASAGRSPLGPLDVGAAAQVVRDGGGSLRAAGGVEIAWWPILRRVFIARMGLVGGNDAGDRYPDHDEHDGPEHRNHDGDLGLTLGAGFSGDRIRLDYAVQIHGHERTTHSFGLAFR